MRTVIAGTAIATVALIAASAVGSAAAETPASSSSRTVSVQGVASVPVAQGASATTATVAYRKAMAAAETDAHEKAEFLASQAGAGLGAVQSIAEDGGWISCRGGEEGEYAEYEGEQPDFGESNGSLVPFVRGAAAPSAAPKPVVQRHHKHRRRHRKVASTHAVASSSSVAVSCTLGTRVALVYALS